MEGLLSTGPTPSSLETRSLLHNGISLIRNIFVREAQLQEREAAFDVSLIHKVFHILRPKNLGSYHELMICRTAPARPCKLNTLF